MSKLVNIFPVPQDTPKKRIILTWIQRMIESQGGLKFHTVLEKIEELIQKQDLEGTTIACHYATNVIIKSKHFNTDQERSEIIGHLKQEIEKLKQKINSKK